MHDYYKNFDTNGAPYNGLTELLITIAGDSYPPLSAWNGLALLQSSLSSSLIAWWLGSSGQIPFQASSWGSIELET